MRISTRWPLVVLAASCVVACAGGSPRTAERDADIVDSIEEGLRRDALVERVPVEVRSEAGHVVLYGSVDSEEESERVESLARSTVGVHTVENHLRVGAGADQRQLPIDAIHGTGIP